MPRSTGRLLLVALTFAAAAPLPLHAQATDTVQSLAMPGERWRAIELPVARASVGPTSAGGLALVVSIPTR